MLWNFSDWRSKRSSYLPLSSASDGIITASWLKNQARRRHLKLGLVILILTVLACVLLLSEPPEVESSVDFGPPDLQDASHPPLYEDLEALELNLPQHNKSLPYPEGETGKYFFPANHIWGLGFNNVFQEHILLAHVAYLANRSLVFDPYIWNWNESEPYGKFGDGKIVPSRIPWHAFLSGPIVGDSFKSGDSAPRFVRKEYFRRVCTYPTTVNSESIDGLPAIETDGQNIVETWVKALHGLPNCLEVFGYSSKHIFDFEMMMSANITTIYNSLAHSPILTNLSWSPLVHSALTTNLPLLYVPKSPLLDWAWNDDNRKSIASFPRLLALHVRRGDYEQHCSTLFHDNATIQGWYNLPGIPDRFDPPSKQQLEERRSYYMERCWPTIDQIVAKINDVRKTKEGKGLKGVYIMSNGDREYLNALKYSIRRMGGWKVISSSRDMTWTWEQKYISQAVDMAIAQRSQVFIGNASIVLKLKLERGITAIWRERASCVQPVFLTLRPDRSSPRMHANLTANCLDCRGELLSTQIHIDNGHAGSQLYRQAIFALAS